jgi:hypothetical protein
MRLSYDEALARQAQYTYNTLAIALIGNPTYPIPAAINLMKKITPLKKYAYREFQMFAPPDHYKVAKVTLATRKDFTLEQAIANNLINEFFQNPYVSKSDFSDLDQVKKITQKFNLLADQEIKTLSPAWQKIFVEYIIEVDQSIRKSSFGYFDTPSDDLIVKMKEENSHIYFSFSSNPNISQPAAIDLLTSALQVPQHLALNNILKNPALPEEEIIRHLPALSNNINAIISRDSISTELISILWANVCDHMVNNTLDVDRYIDRFLRASATTPQILADIFEHLIKTIGSDDPMSSRYQTSRSNLIKFAAHPLAPSELLRQIYDHSDAFPPSSKDHLFLSFVGNPATPEDIIQSILDLPNSSTYWRVAIFNPGLAKKKYLSTAWKRADYHTKAKMLLDPSIPLLPKHIENVSQFYNPSLDVALIRSGRYPRSRLGDFLHPAHSSVAQIMALSILLQDKINFLQNWQPSVGEPELDFIFEYLLDPTSDVKSAEQLAKLAFETEKTPPSLVALIK